MNASTKGRHESQSVGTSRNASRAAPRPDVAQKPSSFPSATRNATLPTSASGTRT